MALKLTPGRIAIFSLLLLGVILLIAWRAGAFSKSTSGSTTDENGGGAGNDPVKDIFTKDYTGGQTINPDPFNHFWNPKQLQEHTTLKY